MRKRRASSQPVARIASAATVTTERNMPPSMDRRGGAGQSAPLASRTADHVHGDPDRRAVHVPVDDERAAERLGFTADEEGTAHGFIAMADEIAPARRRPFVVSSRHAEG